MQQNFADPIAVHDVKGPEVDDFPPGRAFALVHRETAALAGDAPRFNREDVTTMALVYAAHFSPVHIPFEVEWSSVRRLEGEGYIKVQQGSGKGARIEVLVA